MEPKLSVIIPVYKVETCLRQCLDSVARQTYRNLEVIVIDDGSPDLCGQICDEYAAKDSRITVLHKKNEGLSAARNDGIVRATGEWIAFVDSDDWCEPDYYERLLKAAAGQKADIVCAGGHFRDYPSKRKVVQVVDRPCCYRNRNQIEQIQAQITVYGLPWDKLYRTGFLKENGLLFDTGIKAFEDFLFNFQAFAKTEYVCFCTTIGYHYRQSASSIANGFNPRKPELNYKFVSKLHDCAEEYGMSVNIRDGVNAAAICAISVALNCYFYHPANRKKHIEINKEIEQMINQPYYHEAVYSRSNRYLSKRQRVLKYALRTRWGCLAFLYAAKQRLPR